MILRLSLELPEDGAYVRMVRQISTALLDDLQTLPEDKQDVELIVSELCANVLWHTHCAPALYSVLLEYYREMVVIQVQAPGTGFTPPAIGPVGTVRPNLEEERVGWGGLPLLQALSDHLEFTPTEPQGMTLRAEKRLRYRNAEAEFRAEQMDQSGAAARILVQTR